MLDNLHKNQVLSDFRIKHKIIPPLGLGTSRIASIQTGLTKKQGTRLLEQALQLGITLFDTADIYGQGDSESLIGSFILDKRESVIISSKAGFCWNSSIKMKLVKLAKPLIRVALGQIKKGQQVIQQKRDAANTDAIIVQDFSPAYLEQSISASLKRLQTDYLDIFFLHEPTNVIYSEETYQKLLDLKSEGVIKSIGLCTPHIEDWKNHFHPAFDFLQTKVNPLTGSKLKDFYSHLVSLSTPPPQLIAHAVFANFQTVESIITRPEVKQQLIPIFGPHLNAANILLAYAKAIPNVANILLGTIDPIHLAHNINAYKQTPDLSEEDLFRVDSIFREISNF